jgi:hypothetical protein
MVQIGACSGETFGRGALRALSFRVEKSAEARAISTGLEPPKLLGSLFDHCVS